MDKKISLIVPVYKVEPYLRKCVDSILAQTYKNLEVILVDDGSPDNCGAICDEYAARDGRIIVIHQKNGGISAARNAGLDIASGDYVGFVDSDDWIEPDMYEYLLSGALEEKAHIVICGHYLDFPHRSLEQSFHRRQLLKPSQAMEALLEDRLIRSYVWDKLFSRALFDGVRFPVGLNYEDVATTHKTFEAAEAVLCLPQPKYHYLQRSDGIVGRRSLSQAMHCARAFTLRCEDLAPRYPEYIPLLHAGRLSAAISVWTLYLSAEAKLRRQFLPELREMAAFAASHPIPEAYLSGLGAAGKLLVRLLPHANLSCFAVAWLIDRIYHLLNGTSISVG